jgi:glutamyl-tRNA reductase
VFFKKDYRKTRKDCIAKGRKIVCENVDDFMDWFRTRDIGPLIGRMKEKFGQISRKELERFFARVRQEAAHRELTESMVNRIVNKLLYCVIKNINVVAKKYGQAEAAKLVDSIVQQVEVMLSEPDNKEKVHL